jgi:hypothetical protein
MVAVEAGRFTVGVFPDAAWARRGLDALRGAGLSADALTLLAKESGEVFALIEAVLGAPPDRFDIAGLGSVLARGPMIGPLEGPARDLTQLGLAGTMRRVGFQAHDSRIFEALTARGGILVAIHSAPRAADALAILLSHGGGNAAIGAWAGRV